MAAQPGLNPRRSRALFSIETNLTNLGQGADFTDPIR